MTADDGQMFVNDVVTYGDIKSYTVMYKVMYETIE